MELENRTFYKQIQLMHNYNVLNRFESKTRVGNWYEESELNDFKFKEYLYRKDQGMNETLNKKTKLSFSHQNVELSAWGEGKVSFGDWVELGNDFTEAVLAFNINQSLSGEDSYAVTTTKGFEPAMRNVFRVSSTAETEGQFLKYGDKIRLEAQAGDKKLYLQSLPVSPMRSSKFSRNQEVSVTASLNSNSLWIVEHIDGKKRFDATGSQVQANDQILLKHCITGQWLASDKVPYVNDFGSEFEVFAKSAFTNNKTQNLFSQKVGNKSVENPLRNQDLKNSWRILKGK